MESILGCWKLDLEKTENLDAFMAGMGLPQPMIDMLRSRQYQYTFSRKGDLWCCNCRVADDDSVPAKEYAIELGKDHEIENLEGLKMTVNVTWDGSKWVDKSTMPDGSEMMATRTIDGDTKTVVLTMKGQTMKQVYFRC